MVDHMQMPTNRAQRRAARNGEGALAEQLIVFRIVASDIEGEVNIEAPVISAPHPLTWESICTQLAQVQEALARDVDAPDAFVLECLGATAVRKVMFRHGVVTTAYQPETDCWVTVAGVSVEAN